MSVAAFAHDPSLVQRWEFNQGRGVHFETRLFTEFTDSGCARRFSSVDTASRDAPCARHVCCARPVPDEQNRTAARDDYASSRDDRLDQLE